MTDRIEINTSDIQDWSNGQQVNLQDIQDYVESRLPDTTKPKKTGQGQTIGQYFVVSQSDFIDYRIAKRKAKKRSLFWLGLKKLLSWCFSVIFSIVVFCLVIFGFCTLVWYMQTVLVGYHNGL